MTYSCRGTACRARGHKESSVSDHGVSASARGPRLGHGMPCPYQYRSVTTPGVDTLLVVNRFLGETPNPKLQEHLVPLALGGRGRPPFPKGERGGFRNGENPPWPPFSQRGERVFSRLRVTSEWIPSMRR